MIMTGLGKDSLLVLHTRTDTASFDHIAQVDPNSLLGNLLLEMVKNPGESITFDNLGIDAVGPDVLSTLPPLPTLFTLLE